MQNLQDIKASVYTMARSRVANYATPGLNSWLVGGEGRGKVRLFKSDRDTREVITPHSHRFNFTCLVLEGEVTNIIFEHVYGERPGANAYAMGKLKAVEGGLGHYVYEPGEVERWFIEKATTYKAGDTYKMSYPEIHTIRFGRGACVLFFEEPELTQVSTVLEPWSNGKRVPTFMTHPWMFDKGAV
jgi:hypothetical protein